MAESKEQDRIKVIAKARKLHALAERGVEGEKDNATTILNEYLEKNGLTLSDITDTKQLRYFKIFTEAQYEITCFCIRSIFPDAAVEPKKSGLEVRLDDEDYAEAVHKAKFFYEHYLKEEALFLTAFLNRHSEHWKPDQHAENKSKAFYNKKVKEQEPATKGNLSPDNTGEPEEFPKKKTPNFKKDKPNVNLNDTGATLKVNRMMTLLNRIFYQRSTKQK